MLRLIPASLHRLAYKAAHRLRSLVWRVTKPDVTGVSVIGSDTDGQVLLVRLSYGADHWQWPGGGVKRGEQPAEAAAREFREESGCEITHLKALGEIEEDILGAQGTTHVFHGLVDDAPQPDGREVLDARFFPLHSLPHPLSESTSRRLQMFRDRAR